ncbi:hypothetical protein Rhe02_19330 [Rhizocola hellebori]|uniref:Uncharacterized protein n=1 Tax=Rhizocola hellebori TaxID=1392758 RepID=A0A8J3VF34_9ACTN|nr:hypothetical protein [Rhizocola hellebori]GIH03866.1 hypothetical protein Rhe02_19330 [Rhizocola hellebori]
MRQQHGAGLVLRDRCIDLTVFQATGEVGIVAWARQRLPRGVMVDGLVREVNCLARALSGLAARFGLAQMPVRLGFFPAGAQVRTVDIADIESIVDTASFWYRHWPADTVQSRSLRVLVCPRPALTALHTAAAEAGLANVDIELLPDACLRALAHQGDGEGRLDLPGVFTSAWRNGYIVHADSTPPQRPREPRLLHSPLAQPATPPAGLLHHVQPGLPATAASLAAQGLAMAAASGTALDTLLVAARREPSGTAAAFDGSRWSVHAIGQAPPAPPPVYDPVPLRQLRSARRRPGAHRAATRPRLAATATAVVAVSLLAPALPEPAGHPVTDIPSWQAAASPAMPSTPPPSAAPTLSPTPAATAAPPPAQVSAPVVTTPPAPSPAGPKPSPSPTPPPVPSPTLTVIGACHQGPLPQWAFTVDGSGYFSGFTAYPFHESCRGRKVAVRVVMRAGQVGATSGDTVKSELFVSIGGFEWARLWPRDIRTVELTIT